MVQCGLSCGLDEHKISESFLPGVNMTSKFNVTFMLQMLLNENKRNESFNIMTIEKFEIFS